MILFIKYLQKKKYIMKKYEKEIFANVNISQFWQILFMIRIYLWNVMVYAGVSPLVLLNVI